MPSKNEIVQAFETGLEVVFDWSASERIAATQSLSVIDNNLSEAPVEDTFQLIEKADYTRQSYWVAANGLGPDYEFVSDDEGLRSFDGDFSAGQKGLEALKDDAVRESLEDIKAIIDSSLLVCVKAIELDEAILAQCTVRYRAVRYEGYEKPSGIEVHPDGNFLSGLITNGPGLKVYDLNGTLREPPYEGTNVMGGSTLSRWSESRYVPTFHSVSVREGDPVKTSVVGFFNLPDQTEIPRPGSDQPFYHDVKAIKVDDSDPNGGLAALWSVILEKHHIELPEA